VVEYAVLIARKMGFGGRELSAIRMGAMLHDSGKIGIPDSILRKPGKLTDAEWEIMETHPLKGYEAFKGIGFLDTALPIIRHHHERYDGTGYPDGLAGEEIPIGARIFAVADTFDAMTSDRPYRKAMSTEESVQEIIACSGSQFDPKVVGAFLLIPAEEWDLARHRCSVNPEGEDDSANDSRSSSEFPVLFRKGSLGCFRNIRKAGSGTA
jgi:HD-GYP domain-containing protein (c-di-GMP phosphodiesterase class II)